ncbi:hypothetical protein ACIHFE_14010 [Streptomyces sp. NPDC052396]|uniref:hypothetical protein n=1 Tax=Streptomyces sp. NPDC052396 TaxID=3365689 RepID=UPI0037D942B5
MPISLAWDDSLTASVADLGAAARETRMAKRAAQAAEWNAHPGRLNRLDGYLRFAGEHKVRPHDVALYSIWEVCRDYEARTAALYENTARAYAYGTTAAVLAVAGGEQPALVELPWDGDEYVIPGGSLPDLREVTAGWSGAEHLTVLRGDVLIREHAAALISDRAACEALTVADAEALADLRSLAAGLADSSYSYGEQVESALHHLLTQSGQGEQ